MQRIYCPLLPLLLGVLLTSCDSGDRAGQKDPGDEGIRKEFTRGPVTVVLQVDRKEVTIADRLNLLIEVTSQEGYETQLPRFGEKLEQFGIVDYHTAAPMLVEDNKTRIARSYILEPFLSGEYNVPPMKVTFWKKGAEEVKRHEIETEKLTITVKSLLPEKVADLTINDIGPPVDLPRMPDKWIWPTLAVLAIITVVAVCAVIWRRRRRDIDETAPRVPAHELAYGELAKLIAADLPGKGQVKLFYQHISDILRHYIENRFGLHAPEQTTQEFLTDLQSGTDRLSTEYNSLLTAFLNHCDLVKFAEHQPSTSDIQKTFDSCKAFIVGTESDSPPAHGIPDQ